MECNFKQNVKMDLTERYMSRSLKEVKEQTKNHPDVWGKS